MERPGSFIGYIHSIPLPGVQRGAWFDMPSRVRDNRNLMEKVWAIIGKFAVIAAFLGGLIGVGYYLGVQHITPAATPVLPVLTPTQVLSPTAEPTKWQGQAAPTISQSIPVPGGLPSGSGLAFGRYRVIVPLTWSIKSEQNKEIPMDTLTLTQPGYELKIYQAATGGAMCLYPGDPAFEGPSSQYAQFTEVKTKDNILLRRSNTEFSSGIQSRSFTVCAKGTDSFQAPTPFGHISITTPNPVDAKILKEIDDILASFEKTP